MVACTMERALPTGGFSCHPPGAGLRPVRQAPILRAHSQRKTTAGPSLSEPAPSLVSARMPSTTFSRFGVSRTHHAALWQRAWLPDVISRDMSLISRTFWCRERMVE